MRHLIGLGFRCDVAFQLRMHGEENVAHFFDWLATPMEGVIKIIEDDFDVFYPDHLVLNTKHNPNCVEDRVTGVLFHHQFPFFPGGVQPNFLLFYQPFIQKFRYLAARFRSYLETKPVTLVRQGITRDQALRLEEVVLKKFPKADLDFLYILNSGDEFETPMGRAKRLKNDGSSLGDPAEWARVLGEERLIGKPYRHSNLEIRAAEHDNHNQSTDDRFSEAQLCAAIAAHPENVAFARVLSRWYERHGMLEKAEEWALSALALAPHHPGALFQAYSAQWRLAKMPPVEAAERLCALADLPNAPSSWSVEASAALLKAGQTERALIYANHAITQDPINQQNYLQKITVLEAMNRLRPLELALDAAMRLGNVPWVYHHLHATVLERRGDLEAAVAAEQRALQRSETYPSRYTLAGLFLKLGRYQEALDQCQAALPLAGKHRPAVEQRMAEISGKVAQENAQAAPNDRVEMA